MQSCGYHARYCWFIFLCSAFSASAVSHDRIIIFINLYRIAVILLIGSFCMQNYQTFIDFDYFLHWIINDGACTIRQLSTCLQCFYLFYVFYFFAFSSCLENSDTDSWMSNLSDTFLNRYICRRNCSSLDPRVKVHLILIISLILIFIII